MWILAEEFRTHEVEPVESGRAWLLLDDGALIEVDQMERFPECQIKGFNPGKRRPLPHALPSHSPAGLPPPLSDRRLLSHMKIGERFFLIYDDSLLRGIQVSCPTCRTYINTFLHERVRKLAPVPMTLEFRRDAVVAREMGIKDGQLVETGLFWLRSGNNRILEVGVSGRKIVSVRKWRRGKWKHMLYTEEMEVADHMGEGEVFLSLEDKALAGRLLSRIKCDQCKLITLSYLL
ncbi:MAG: hypothetical protein QW356_08075 [Candidatus Hadarchaeales archaeon]